jgi:hypothetical protein
MSKLSFSFTLAFLVNTLLVYSQHYEIQVVHNTMETEIGQPAYISPGSNTPAFRITAHENCSVTGELLLVEEGTVISASNEIILTKGGSTTVMFQEFADKNGLYRADFKVRSGELGNTLYYESYYYTVLEARKLRRWNSLVVHPGENGHLRYVPDYLGNHIPDFSTAGYKGGGVEIPNVAVMARLEPKEGDDTKRIQEAIDKVSSMLPDNNGIRGAVLLTKGIYEINSTLEIRESGVVLRGEGSGDYKKSLLDPSLNYSLEAFKYSNRNPDITLLIATGNDRRPLINITGQNNHVIDESSVAEIIDQYVPVGAKSFRVNNPGNFNVGDDIIIQRSGNEEWIKAIGMDNIPQSPSVGSVPPHPWRSFNLHFENKITGIKDDIIFVEGSVMNAIEVEWGGGRIYRYSDTGRISDVGIENLRAVSFWIPDQFGVDDTKHADRFLNVVNIKDGWVNNIAMEHFYASGGAINISRTARNITVLNSSSLIADRKYYSGPAYRRDRTNIETGVEVGRYGFYIEGQSNLVAGCYTINDRRSFGVGSRVSGPNVFLDCRADNSITTSEPHHRWSVGGLYDNVTDDISIVNRLYHGTGQGWAGANYVTWNTRGRISIEKPPTAQNWSIGHKGRRLNRLFHNFIFEDGFIDLQGSNVLPRSLYIHQLKDRLGDDADLHIFNNLMKREMPEDIKVWNYPNPADYFTILVFTLEERSRIVFSVYSYKGEKVTVSDFGWQEPGYHEVIWETTDDMGRPLTDGIYIYQLQVNDRSYTNKLLISK